MCGRYYRRGQKQELAERMRAGVIDPEIPDLLEHYNIAPTTFQPVVRHTRDGGTRELLLMRWGMVPFFASSLSTFRGFSTINARCEDVTAKPMWNRPLTRGQRCLVPADGFYEWKTLGESAVTGSKKPSGSEGKAAGKPAKQPYAFTVHPPGSDTPVPFAFAGLWDAWHNKSDDHNRMPVILDPRDWDEWLLREGPAPTHLLQPFPAQQMAKRPVHKDVGNVRNNHPELLNSA